MKYAIALILSVALVAGCALLLVVAGCGQDVDR